MLMKHTVERTFVISGGRPKQSVTGVALITLRRYFAKCILQSEDIKHSGPLLFRNVVCNFSNELPGTRTRRLYFRGCYQNCISRVIKSFRILRESRIAFKTPRCEQCLKCYYVVWCWYNIYYNRNSKQLWWYYFHNTNIEIPQKKKNKYFILKCGLRFYFLSNFVIIIGQHIHIHIQTHARLKFSNLFWLNLIWFNIIILLKIKYICR